ncbi:unnamed protein product [Anisakis simplex]|uniref:Coiled-coil domain-containing protein 93 n=1 Tax=Anisakis simplex TaxID=6269 RepID=A0A3P6Q2I6_ANISI|nr:unnamed protein product [Anisakis simplex]
MQDTIDLLVAAGYFRARFKALSPFDRVIGGMVWCITLCNRSVDVDLFYSENSTIGQKIALTERVVEVLPQLKCPYSIEPHQIQGLDYIHIFPVVQWLVKQAIEAKSRRGDTLQNYAIHQFATRFRRLLPEEGEKCEDEVVFTKHRANLKAQCSPLRVYRRTNGYCSSAANECDLHKDVEATIMEYTATRQPYSLTTVPSSSQKRKSCKEENKDSERKGQQEGRKTDRIYAETGGSKQTEMACKRDVGREDEGVLQTTSIIPVCSDAERISIGALANIIDVKAIDEASAGIDTVIHESHKGIEGDELGIMRTRVMLDEAEQELERLHEDEKRLDDELFTATEVETNLLEEIRELEHKIQAHLEFEQSVDKEFVNIYPFKIHVFVSLLIYRLVDRLTQLMAEHDELRNRESTFKTNCKRELLRMQQQLEKIVESRGNERRSCELLESHQEYEEAKEHLERMRLQAASINRSIAVQQRRLDSVPSQIEISQYQRRIIELYNQMASKHRETKQFYTEHNTLLDVKAYLQREIDLLNSIEDVQQLTSKESYKESFIENLEHVLKGVDATLDKVSSKQKQLRSEREQLSDDYQYLLDKERLYHKTIDDFKKVICEISSLSIVSPFCSINHSLRLIMKNSPYNESLIMPIPIPSFP